MKKPVPWLVVLLIVIAAGEGLGALLAAQGAGEAAAWVRVLGRLAGTGWLVWGLHVWRETPWVARARAGLLAVLAAQLVAGVSWVLGWTDAVWIVAGAFGMAATFFVGLYLVRLALSWGHPIVGVARTLVDEAIRMRLPVVFIVGLMLVVPTLPFVLNPDDRLEYRLQSFLSWSTIAVSLLLSLMTVFLAIGTVTRELDRRQIFLSLTKPVRRWQYLAGKWLGVAALNAVLVATAGVGVYGFTRFLAQQRALDAADRAAVTERVLVARDEAAPTPPDASYFDRAFEERVELMRANDPTWVAAGVDLTERQIATVREALVTEWYSVGPRQTKTFVFHGLGAVRERAERVAVANAARGPGEPPLPRPQVQLRIEPKATGEVAGGFVRLRMRINGRPYLPPAEPGTPLEDRKQDHELSEDTPHTLRLPADIIDEQGRLALEINVPVTAQAPQGTVSFDPEEGLRVLYRVGGFGGNLARAMVLLWVRLGFLAALAIAASTFLGFPVAALLCSLVFLVASGGSFIAESLDNYSASPRDVETTWELLLWYPQAVWGKLAEGEVGDGVKIVIRGVGELFAFFVPSFDRFSGGDLVANGRLVSGGRVLEALLKVGVVWAGACAAIGYLIFSRKELARVTV